MANTTSDVTWHKPDGQAIVFTYAGGSYIPQAGQNHTLTKNMMFMITLLQEEDNSCRKKP
jgi:hypothetical protein